MASLIAILDAGTPLLWAVAFHLYIGNLLIGLIEAVFVRKVFHINLRLLGFILIIIANYCSMFVGLHFVSSRFKGVMFTDSNISGLEILIAVTGTLLVSIIIELPFYYTAIKSSSSNIGFKKIVSITSLAQVVSYLCILAYYFLIKLLETTT